MHASTYALSNLLISLLFMHFIFLFLFFFLLFEQEIIELKSIIAECQNDRDMKEMASEELHRATEEEKGLQNLLLKMLLPKDDADERDCILEVRAGNTY